MPQNNFSTAAHIGFLFCRSVVTDDSQIASSFVYMRCSDGVLSPLYHRQHLPGQPAKALLHLTSTQKSKEADLKAIESVTSGSVSGATEGPKPEQLKPEPVFWSEEPEKSSTETGATLEGPVKPSIALPSSGTSEEVTDLGDSSVTASESLEVKELHPASGSLPDDDEREK